MSQAKIIEWPSIRSAVFMLVICAMIAAMLVGSSWYFRDQMEQTFMQNKQMFQNISSRYLAVDQEESYIREFYPEFIRLHDQGIIGREHRLNWIEVLRNSGKEIRLPSLDYSIGSQTEYENPFAINTSSYKLFKSRMELSLSLLHEGDLLELIDRLDEETTGLFSFESCEFGRKHDRIDMDPARPAI